jgi:hypothetical protein
MCFVIGVGFLVRLYLSVTLPLWLDEKLVLEFIRHPFSQLISGVLDPSHPPGYYFLLKTLSYVSSDILFLRFIHILFFVYNSVLIYHVGKRMYPKLYGSILVFCYVFSGYFLIFDWQMRVYTPLLSLILTSLYLFSDTSKNSIVLFTIVNIIGLYFDYAYVYYFVTLCIFCLTRRAENGWARRLLSVTISGGTFLFYIPTIMTNFSRGLPWWSTYYTRLSFSIPFLLGTHTHAAITYTSIGILLWSIFCLIRSGQRVPIQLCLILTGSVVMLFVFFVGTPIFGPTTHVRTLQIVGLTIICFVAYGLSHHYGKTVVGKSVSLILAALIVMNFIFVVEELPRFPSQFLIKFVQ